MPEVFGQPTSLKSSSTAATTSTRADLGPLHARHRIEVDAQLVGMLEVLGAHRVRVQLQAGEVREPGERRGVARHDLLGRAPDGKRSSTVSIQGGRLLGARFW